MTRPCPRSRIRSFVGCVLCVALAILAVPERAGAQYILYYATHGDWAVTCSEDPPTGRRSCGLTAPLPRAAAGTPLVRVWIDETAAEPTVAFRILEPIDASRPVSMIIDTGAPATVEPTRHGEGAARGAAAAAAIESMRKGRRLSLVWMLEGSRTPRTADLALDGFDAALADYRQRLAAFGIAGSR